MKKLEEQEEMNQLFKEICTHLMEDQKPSHYLEECMENPLFHKEPFFIISSLKNVKQSPIHHPEGNVWNHTLLVVDEAAKVKELSREPLVFMCAALLHDIGKAKTTKIRKGKITSYEHDIVGAELARKFLEEIDSMDQKQKEEVIQLVRYHMYILYVIHGMKSHKLSKILQEEDIREIALLGWCDRVGRKGKDRKEEEENIRLFYRKATGK